MLGAGRRVLALLAAGGLLATACGAGATGPADPTRALVDAVERTFAQSFSYEVEVDLDEAAERHLLGEQPALRRALRSLRVSGQVDASALALRVEALGATVAEVRELDRTETYWRVDAEALEAVTGQPADRDMFLGGAAEQSSAARELTDALLAGEWVGVLGETSSPAGTLGAGDPERLREATAEHFGASPAEFASRFLVASEQAGPPEGQRELAVQLRLRAMVRAGLEMATAAAGRADPEGSRDHLERLLEGVPTGVDGLTVQVEDRRLTRVVVDVLELAGDPDADSRPPGSLQVSVALSEHGQAPPVTAPEGATEFEAEALGPAILALRQLSSGLAPSLALMLGLGSGSGSSSQQVGVDPQPPSLLPEREVEVGTETSRSGTSSDSASGSGSVRSVRPSPDPDPTGR